VEYSTKPILESAHMNIHIDLSGLGTLFSSVSLEQMLCVAVLALALAAAILVRAWKFKK
jgi:hypothetical protein